jgi:hypothetical protein
MTVTEEQGKSLRSKMLKPWNARKRPPHLHCDAISDFGASLDGTQGALVLPLANTAHR